MTVSIRVEVQGCSVVPVVNGRAWTAWPFNDNNAANLAAWLTDCSRYMREAAEQAGALAEFDPEWVSVAAGFFATSQAAEWRQ